MLVWIRNFQTKDTMSLDKYDDETEHLQMSYFMRILMIIIYSEQNFIDWISLCFSFELETGNINQKAFYVCVVEISKVESIIPGIQN